MPRRRPIVAGALLRPCRAPVVPTVTHMRRRELRLESFPELKDELARLRATEYRRAGEWSLGQVCEHLSLVMTMSMDGFGDVRVPWFVRAGGPLVKWVVLRRGKMPAGVRGPKPFMPAGSLPEDARKVDEFVAVIDRYEAFDRPLQASPLFGRMRRAEWDRIHLIHAAHHLGFIVPEVMRK